MRKLYSTNLKTEEKNKTNQLKDEVIQNILQFEKSYEVLKIKKRKIGITLN